MFRKRQEERPLSGKVHTHETPGHRAWHSPRSQHPRARGERGTAGGPRNCTVATMPGSYTCKHVQAHMYIHVNTYIPPHVQACQLLAPGCTCSPCTDDQVESARAEGLSWSQSFLGCAHSPWGLAENLEQWACLGIAGGSVLWPGQSCSCRSRPQARAHSVWPGAGLAALLEVCAGQVP